MYTGRPSVRGVGMETGEKRQSDMVLTLDTEKVGKYGGYEATEDEKQRG